MPGGAGAPSGEQRATAWTIASRPRIKATAELFEASDGNVYLMPGGGDEDFVVRDASDLDRSCLRSLTGHLTVGELHRRLIATTDKAPALEDLLDSLEVLRQRGLVEDALDDQHACLNARERDRFDRQLAYLGDMLAPGRSRSLAHAALRGSRVAIVGVGGFGSWTALALAAAGVGALDLIDGDRVEASNLSRQVLYGEADLGVSKATAAARRIRALDSSIAVKAVDRFIDGPTSAMDLLAAADFVVELGDEPVHDLSRWINAACHASGTPHIAASMFPPKLRVGPLVVPGSTACFECQEAGFREAFALYAELCDYRRARGSIGAPFAPGCAAIGGLLAGEVTHYLTGIDAVSTLGAAVIVDLRTMRTTREPIARREDCPACAAAGLPTARSGLAAAPTDLLNGSERNAEEASEAGRQPAI